MHIVFDIGATNTRIASADNGRINNVQSYPTIANFEEGLDKFINTVKDIADSQTVKKLSGGFAGIFNQDNSSFTHGGNLQEWSNRNLSQILSQKLDCQVLIKNDAGLAALGEAHHGAGKDFATFIYYTISTGIGGAWIIDKQLASNKFSFEPGHQLLDFKNQITLGSLISGNHLSNKLRQPIQEVDDQILWSEIKPVLLAGLYNSFLHWPSQAIILGGGIINNSNFSLAELEAELGEKLKGFQISPKVLASKLKDQAGLYGALYI